MITALATVLLTAPLGKDIEYTVGSERFVGYAAKSKKFNSKSPVVYVIQDWNGVDGHEKEVVEKLAKAGFSAFAIDIYGKVFVPAMFRLARQNLASTTLNLPSS